MNPIDQLNRCLELAESIKELESVLISEKENLEARMRMFPNLPSYQQKLIVANLRSAILTAMKKYNEAIQELLPYSIN